jgi:hypothetical protein
MNAPHLHGRQRDQMAARSPAPRPEPLWKSALAMLLWALVSFGMFFIAGILGG